MKKNVVLYPGLGVGHLVSMVELAEVFLEHGFAVTLVLIEDPIILPSFTAAVERVVRSHPSICFRKLPPIPSFPSSHASDSEQHFLLMYLAFVRRRNGQLHDLLCSDNLQPLHALVVDMYSTAALDVAKKLAVPAYTFFPMGAATLCVLLQLPSFRASNQASFKELGDSPLEFFGVPPVPASHLFREMLQHPDSEVYRAAMNVYERIPESDGILVNSFESLETRAVRALSDPRCRPGRVLTPVYCVGPLVDKSGNGERDGEGQRHQCLAWLDGQPDHSVVFLCFGSLGTHREEQLKAMAAGLEKSGHRFLWVVRAPHSDDPKEFRNSRAEPDLEALLPEGFLERTNDRGLVVKSWVPQADVLRHRATGGFVTHCGWNSVLEAVTAGVPMMCWPLFAEQKMNKVFMVEEMMVAVEVEGCQVGAVTAEEMEAKVRLVMESSQDGKGLRERVARCREGAVVAWKDGGSSQAAFARFLSDVEISLIGRRTRC